jgi:hypothetical protein
MLLYSECSGSFCGLRWLDFLEALQWISRIEKD